MTRRRLLSRLSALPAALPLAFVLAGCGKKTNLEPVQKKKKKTEG
jgi:hypothetical protein